MGKYFKTIEGNKDGKYVCEKCGTAYLSKGKAKKCCG